MHLCVSAPVSLTAGMEVLSCAGRKEDPSVPAAADDGAGTKASWKRLTPEILSVFSIRASFSIGDTVCKCQQSRSSIAGIPTFAPEHFARVRQVDTMKTKAVRQRHRRRSPWKVRSRSSRNTIPVWKRSSSAWSVPSSLRCCNTACKMNIT